jgi:GTP-binding protein
VLTKCDQLSANELAARMADMAAQIARSAAAFPDILATSSREGTGIPELRAAIARLVAERK